MTRGALPVRFIFLAALSAAVPARAQPAPQAPDSAPRIEVVGAEFRILAPDGKVTAGADLVGTVLSLRDAAGNRLDLRIDEVLPDPKDSSGEVTLYAFSYRAPSAATAWTPLCHPGPDGLAMGFPLPGGAGPAEPDGPVLSTAAFRLTCTSGAVGKCVRAGYKPWKLANDGATSLAPYHEACTRMIRADYCGNGTPHTREGTTINIFDRLGVQTRDDDPKMEFEAAWGPAGAVCVRKPRIPGLTSLDALVAMCPDRLRDRVGPSCDADSGLRMPGALLFNESYTPAAGSRD